MLYYQPQKLAFNIVTNYNIPEDFDLYSFYNAFKNEFSKDFLVDENESLSVVYARMYNYLKDNNKIHSLNFDNGEIEILFECDYQDKRIDLYDFYLEKNNEKVFKPLLFLLKKIVAKGMNLPSFIYEYHDVESFYEECLIDEQEWSEDYKDSVYYRFKHADQSELYEMESLVINFKEEYSDKFILKSLKNTRFFNWSKKVLLSIKDSFHVSDFLPYSDEESLETISNFYMFWTGDDGIFSEVNDHLYQPYYNECMFSDNLIKINLSDFKSKEEHVKLPNRFISLPYY